MGVVEALFHLLFCWLVLLVGQYLTIPFHVMMRHSHEVHDLANKRAEWGIIALEEGLIK